MRRLALALLAVAPLSGPALAGPAVEGFLAHRAVYDISLVKVTGKSSLSNVSGRIVNEIGGNSCEGFTTKFRFVTRMQGESGEPRLTDIRTSTFEAGDGSMLNFVNQSYLNGRLTEDGKGVARKRDGKVQVEMAQPEQKSVSLPVDLEFPTAHLGRIIDAAREGKRIVEIGLYDGTDGGDRSYRTSVVIGRPLSANEVGDEKAADIPELAAIRSWPITISYFDVKKSGGGEDLPEYELSAVLYENGVSRNLKLQYGEFELAGRLSEIAVTDQKPCK